MLQLYAAATSGSVFLYVGNSTLVDEIESRLSFSLSNLSLSREIRSHAGFRERLSTLLEMEHASFRSTRDSRFRARDIATAAFTGSLAQRAGNNAQ